MATGTKGVAWEKAVLDYVLGGQRPAALASVFFALFTTCPTEGDDTYVEVTGGSYARVSVTNNLTNFPSATKLVTNPSRKVSNSDIVFAIPTASWGTVTGVGIMSASTAGTLFYWFPITPGVAVSSGGTAYKIPAGQLLVTEK